MTAPTTTNLSLAYLKFPQTPLKLTLSLLHSTASTNTHLSPRSTTQIRGPKKTNFQTNMWIAVFDDFLKAAIKLYNDAPERVRFVHKYRAADRQLTLKMTDDKVVRFAAPRASCVAVVSLDFDEMIAFLFFSMLVRGLWGLARARVQTSERHVGSNGLTLRARVACLRASATVYQIQIE